MANGYQPLIHAGVVRQAAEMRAIASGEALRTGSRESILLCISGVLRRFVGVGGCEREVCV